MQTDTLKTIRPMGCWQITQHALGSFDDIPLAVTLVRDVASQFIFSWSFRSILVTPGNPTFDEACYALYLALRFMRRQRPNKLLTTGIPEAYLLAVLRELGIKAVHPPGPPRGGNEDFEHALDLFNREHADWQTTEGGYDFIQGAFGRWLDDHWNNVPRQTLEGKSPVVYFTVYRPKQAIPQISGRLLRRYLLNIGEKRELNKRIPHTIYREEAQVEQQKIAA